MQIADMILPEGCVVGRDCVNLVMWTGRPLNNLPVRFRDRDDGITYVSSVTAELNDSNCDPRSGGIAGHEHICQFYGVGPQQFARYIAPKLPFLRWLGNIPVSNVNSVQVSGLAYRDAVNKKRRENLIQFDSTGSQ